LLFLLFLRDFLAAMVALGRATIAPAAGMIYDTLLRISAQAAPQPS
jgi:hypothetical protein